MRAGLGILALLVAGQLEGQDLASRIAGSRSEKVTFTYEGRAGVCGSRNGVNVRNSWRDRDDE